MNTNHLSDLLKYRIKQAHDTIDEAEILYAKNTLRGTVNRAYYAMFYAVLALLATKQLGISKHSGTISLFDNEFVKAGIFSPQMSKSLRMAFDVRQTSDYGEMIEIDEKIAQQTLNDARLFVSEVEKYLINSGFFIGDSRIA